MAVRKNAHDLTDREKIELNEILGNMKSINSKNNWKSFEKVANIHGEPFMCNEAWQDTSLIIIIYNHPFKAFRGMNQYLISMASFLLKIIKFVLDSQIK